MISANPNKQIKIRAKQNWKCSSKRSTLSWETIPSWSQKWTLETLSGPSGRNSGLLKKTSTWPKSNISRPKSNTKIKNPSITLKRPYLNPIRQINYDSFKIFSVNCFSNELSSGKICRAGLQKSQINNFDEQLHLLDKAKV